MPVHDEYGSQQGCVLRSYTGDLPKARTYVQEGYSRLHFPGRTASELRSEVMAVEDIPSAEALSLYFPTVAILGSYLTTAQCEHLLRSGVDVVHLALDEDASAKSINQSRRHLAMDVRPVLLAKDPKDMDDAELLELTERVR